MIFFSYIPTIYNQSYLSTYKNLLSWRLRMSKYDLCFIYIIMFWLNFLRFYKEDRPKGYCCNGSDMPRWLFFHIPSLRSASGVVWPVPDIIPKKFSENRHKEHLRNKIWLSLVAGLIASLRRREFSWVADENRKRKSGIRSSWAKVCGRRKRGFDKVLKRSLLHRGAYSSSVGSHHAGV